MDDAVFFKLAELLGEHLLSDGGNGPLQVGKAHDLAAEELEEDQKLPAALQHAESTLDTLRRGEAGPAYGLLPRTFHQIFDTYFFVGSCHFVSRWLIPVQPDSGRAALPYQIMKTTPPQVISDYFTAVNERRLDDAAACFAPDARVHDESHDHVGAEAIRAWIDDTTHKYQPKAEVTGVEAAADEGAFIATATVSGTFPGSPIQLAYTFSIAEGKITRLSIQ